MNTTRLIEIGIELGKLYQDRADASLHEWQAEQDANRFKINLTPTDGWPGKNEEQRRIAAEKAFAADQALQDALNAVEDHHLEIMLIDGNIGALEAERRSLEWAIRAQLTQTLSTAGIQKNHNGRAPEETAFDDVADHRVDRAAFEGAPVDYSEFHQTPLPASYEMLAPEPEDELPF